MGYRRYRGPVHTVEQAMFADMPVRVTCSSCGHFQLMHAFALMQRLSERRKERGVNLWEPVPGFYCLNCKRKVSVIITAPMQWT